MTRVACTNPADASAVTEVAEVLTYHPNGTVSCRTPYVDNYEHGVETRYDENGQVSMTVTWAWGELHGYTHGYLPSGELEYIQLYHHDALVDITLC